MNNFKTDNQTWSDHSFESTTMNEMDVDFFTASSSPGHHVSCGSQLETTKKKRSPKNAESASTKCLDKVQEVRTVQYAKLEEHFLSKDSRETTGGCEDSLIRSVSDEITLCAKTSEDIESSGFNHFDMSLLSPLQEKAIDELSALVQDARKSPAGACSFQWGFH